MGRRKQSRKKKSKKRRGGIWVGNKFGKEKSWRKKDGGRIKPVVKKCLNCKKRRVRHHHIYCHQCWLELHDL